MGDECHRTHPIDSVNWRGDKDQGLWLSAAQLRWRPFHTQDGIGRAWIHTHGPCGRYLRAVCLSHLVWPDQAGLPWALLPSEGWKAIDRIRLDAQPCDPESRSPK